MKKKSKVVFFPAPKRNKAKILSLFLCAINYNPDYSEGEGGNRKGKEVVNITSDHPVVAEPFVPAGGLDAWSDQLAANSIEKKTPMNQ